MELGAHLRHPGASTIGSQLLDEANLGNWAMRPHTEGETVTHRINSGKREWKEKAWRRVKNNVHYKCLAVKAANTFQTRST